MAPPCCYGAPVAAPAPELVVAKPRPLVPMWSSRIGLGVRGTGTVVILLFDGLAPSLLRLSAAERLAAVAVVIALLWGVVLWAIA